MDLLDPPFIRELEALRRRLLVRARSGQGGDLVAKRRGGNAEFLDHRPYAAGDDPRRIDWLAFARTGDPVFKLFRAEEDVVVRLVVDASASMDFGDPTKLDCAKRVAAGLGYMATVASQRVQVLVARDGLERAHEPLRGRASLPRLLRELSELGASGRTDLPRVLKDVVQRSARPGMLVVLSDFMDAAVLELALGRGVSAGHDVHLVQILADEEVHPPQEGDVAFEDAETGATVEVTLDDRALALYEHALESHVSQLRAVARRLNATYVRMLTTDPIMDGMRRIVRREID